MYSSVSVVNNKARLDIVLNAPEDILDQSFMNDVNQQMLKRAKDFGLGQHQCDPQPCVQV